MAEPRLRVEIWVKAQLRLCDQAMLPAFIRQRGDPDAGAVIVKLDRMDGTSEAYIQRQLSFDPDIWVLEVEDPKLRYVLDGPLIT